MSRIRINIFVFLTVISYTNCILIESPRITDWGEWGNMEKCPSGTFVTGMQLKVEKLQRGIFSQAKDNTGLNGIRFYCSDPGRVGINDNNIITSSIGNWGDWRNTFFCGSRYGKDEVVGQRSIVAATGFQLRSESEKGRDDDSAATNLRLLCSKVSINHSDAEVIEGDGLELGDWTETQMCPPLHAFCGLATQVEDNQGKRRDDTSLNNLRVECCDIYDFLPAIEVTSNRNILHQDVEKIAVTYLQHSAFSTPATTKSPQLSTASENPGLNTTELVMYETSESILSPNLKNLLDDVATIIPQERSTELELSESNVQSETELPVPSSSESVLLISTETVSDYEDRERNIIAFSYNSSEDLYTSSSSQLSYSSSFLFVVVSCIIYYHFS